MQATGIFLFDVVQAAFRTADAVFGAVVEIRFVRAEFRNGSTGLSDSFIFECLNISPNRAFSIFPSAFCVNSNKSGNLFRAENHDC